MSKPIMSLDTELAKYMTAVDIAVIRDALTVYKQYLEDGPRMVDVIETPAARPTKHVVTEENLSVHYIEARLKSAARMRRCLNMWGTLFVPRGKDSRIAST